MKEMPHSEWRLDQVVRGREMRDIRAVALNAMMSSAAKTPATIMGMVRERRLSARRLVSWRNAIIFLHRFSSVQFVGVVFDRGLVGPVYS